MLDEENSSNESCCDQSAEAPREIAISWAYSNKGPWFTWRGPLPKFGKKFLTRRVGPKNGLTYLQGALMGDKRSSAAMVASPLVVLDSDNGQTAGEIAAKIASRGLWAFISPTHSHLSTITDIKEDAFNRHKRKRAIEDDLEAARDYLRNEKKYVPAIVESVSVVVRKADDEGMKFFVTHAPIPKYRIIFILSEPFSFMSDTVPHSEFEKEWKSRYMGFANSLDLVFDSKCQDPARLFYAASCPADSDPADYEGLEVEGELLRWQDMPHAVDKRAKPREESGAAKAGEFQTKNMRWFLASQASKYFLAAAWYEAASGEEPRAVRDEKYHFESPFDEYHSNAGDPADQSFFVKNADPQNDEGWFMYGCHNSDSEHSGDDRARYLDAACVKFGVHDAKELLAWCLGYEKAAEDEEKVRAAADDLDAEIAGLSSKSTDPELAVIFKAIALKVSLESGLESYAQAIKKKTDRLIGDVRKELKAAWNAERRAAGADNSVPERLAPVPGDPHMAGTIWAHWPYKDQIACAMARLTYLNEKDPTLFMRGGATVRLAKCDGRPLLKELQGSHAWNAELTDRLTFKAGNEAKNEETPPIGCVLNYMCGTTKHDFPVIEGISEVPLYAPDGTLQTEEGFIPSARVYLAPRGEFLPLPERVTRDDVDEALMLLKETVRDMPFSDAFDGDEMGPIYLDECDDEGYPLRNEARGASSFAHFVAMLVQPFVAPMIPGPMPQYHIDKPKAGTGASLLIQINDVIQTGEVRGTIQIVGEASSEVNKKITSAILAGDSALVFDNLETKLSNAALNNFATTGVWKDRLLGGNSELNTRYRGTVIFAGNNVTFDTQTRRRLVPIRLDTNCADPATERTAFKYPRLIEEMKKHRVDLVWACHVLIANWIQVGQPRWDGGVLASFEVWSGVMGGILREAGVEGFLGSLKDYRAAAHQDEGNDFRALVQAIVDDRSLPPEFTAKDILPLCWSGPTSPSLLEVDIGLSGLTEGRAVQQLGTSFAKHARGNVFSLDAGKRVKIVAVRDRSPARYRLVGV